MAMHELLKLKLTFEEIRIRGQEPIHCVLRAEEDASWVYVTEMLENESWEKIKELFPTLRDVLVAFFDCEVWEAGSRGGNRRITISEITGHEGLYEFDPENPPAVEWEDRYKSVEDAK